MLYLVEKYDTKGRIRMEDLEEKSEMVQWMFSQSSGQGPMFTQLFYFSWRPAEQVPIAIKRYQEELIKLYTTLEAVREKFKDEEEKEWLVGGELTVAGLVFVIWNHFASFLMSQYEGRFDLKADYPNVTAWHKRMLKSPGVKRVLDAYAALNPMYASLREGWYRNWG